MGLMEFLEIMGTSEIAYISAFFIGLMMAISPCPLATNITAIAYMSKRIENSKHTIIVGLFYTFGRMFTYVLLASLIVWFGLNMQIISLSLQKYSYIFLGPILIIIGLIMLNIIKFNFIKKSNHFENLKSKLSKKGYLGSFLLGCLFALAFCPFSAVLFFAMLIPLALQYSDGIIIPSIFAFATGLPVIIFSFILVYSVSKLSGIMNKVTIFEKWMRRIVAIIFIIVGLYYSISFLI